MDGKKSPKDNIEDTERTVLEAYFSAVMRKYSGSSPQQRTSIRMGLDKILYDEEENVSPTKLIFDRVRAKEIRNSFQISQTDLAKQLGIRIQAISFYEQKGISRPYGSNSGKYLDWLKSKGYNPFNI